MTPTPHTAAGWRRLVVAALAFGLGSVGIAQTVQAAGPCGPDQEIRIAGALVCVHTDAAADLLAGPRAAVARGAAAGPSPTSAAAERPATSGTALLEAAAAEDPDDVPLKLICDRTSSSRRIEALYAYPKGANDLKARRAELEDHVRFAQLQYDFSAFVAGSQRSYIPRLVTEGTGEDCRVKITAVEISPGAMADMGVFFNELHAKGYDDPNRSYLTFVEEGPYCGAGTIVADDRSDPRQNDNNVRTDAAYARIDEPCWGFAEAHELGHNLGAVQFSAPHATEGGHCTDGYDAMCYPDGSPSSAGYSETACPDELAYFALDCNNDDYYDPSPAPGSYLATHWNIVDNDWLLETFTDAALVGLTVGPTGTRFDDVLLDDLFMRDIDDLARNRVTRGCNPGDGNTRFCPGDQVTREQMAAFLTRALKLPAGTTTFSDVPAGSIFHADIAALADADVTRGCNPGDGNTKFCPKDPVTREQMAAFLTRALDLSAGSKTFTDVGSDNVFRADIAALAHASITRGCNPPDNTRFCPKDPVTRGQMAAFLNRTGLLTE